MSAPDGSAYQGRSVAMSSDGSTAIVGGPSDNFNSNCGCGVGAAWVFVQPTAPSLQVTPTTNIVAAGNPGGPFAPSSFQYQLSATAGSINYSISGYPNWLTPSAISGTASSGTTVTFTVNANANGLAVGTYGPITFTFTNSDTGQGTQTRNATLTVNPPALQVTPATNITSSGTHGGPFSPSSFQYALSATYGTVNYSIMTPSWLTVSSSSGAVTTSAKTITFKINSSAADKLAPNTYINSISFNNTTNSPRVAKGSETGALFRDFRENVQQVPSRTSETIQPRYDHYIAALDDFQKAPELRPVSPCTADLFPKDLGAAGGFEVPELRV